MKCKVTFHNGTKFDNVLYVLNLECALVIQNFVNTLGFSPENPVSWAWESEQDSCGFSDEEYKALLDNAELLGIEFIVEGS